MIAIHKDSDGTGYCRGCGTTIGEHHHNNCDVLEVRRLEADKLMSINNQQNTQVIRTASAVSIISPDMQTYTYDIAPPD